LTPMLRRAVARAKCSKCERPAVAEIRYARLRLCREHFNEFMEKKVERVLRRVGVLQKGRIVVAAVSGGKDSSTMLAILSKLSKKYGFRVIGVHIVLGIREYSEKSLEKIQQLCRELRVECLVIDLERVIGFTVPELARRAKRPTCSVCGLVKRYILNAVGVELGADYVALGHNTDDIIAYSIKSFINHDITQLAKFGPSTETIKGVAIGRLRPLFEVYERESLLYALVNKLPIVIDECPFRPRSPMEDKIKEFMNSLEDDHPGIKLAFVRRLEKRLGFYKSLAESQKYGRCKYCGLLSAGDVCSFCRVTEKAAGKPLGPLVRSEIRRLVASIRERSKAP